MGERRRPRTILRIEQLVDRIVPATWPVPSSHEMLFGFGDWTAANEYKYHEGIDILADGLGGQNVVAARRGVVTGSSPT
jgi:murein DD-endopeptidase MepM/ murein hydrolase activator NlpD